MKKKGYLGIVTARSGSQRMLNKNIRELFGKPLFVWSVLAGMNCPEIEKIIVSTDSKEYQDIAISAGAHCPWLRDASLASNEASSIDTVKDLLERYPEAIDKYKGLVLLQPTSPLRTAEDISTAIKIYESTSAPAVVSVCETECPPAWIGKLEENNIMDNFASSDSKGLRSQDFEQWHRLNGAIYLIGISQFLETLDFIPKGTRAYIMPRERSIDIDNEIDFIFAHAILSQQKNI